MTEQRSPPREVLQAMGEEAAPLEDAWRADARRARVVGAVKIAIERAAVERTRRQRRMGFISGFAVAAALLVGLGIAWRTRAPSQPSVRDSAPAAFARMHAVTGTVLATHDGYAASAPPSSDVELRGGDEISTDPGAKTDVTLADGVALSLEGASHLRLPDAPASGTALDHEEVRFDAGLLRVRVPHLTAGHTFSVRTPDAEVTVHGTAFTVEVMSGVTRVAVTEGVVSVAGADGGREVLLTAGMQWPPASTSSAVASDAPPAAASSITPRNRAAAKNRTPTRQEAGPTSASSLAEQNGLLASALDASRAGDDRRAIDLLNDLLTRFPSSPLAQEAYVQRFRAFERSGDHREAARQARQYLASHPNGFAREEAKKLALEH